MRDVRRDVMSFIRALIRMWQVFIPNKKKKIMTLTFQTSIIMPHQTINSCNVHSHINLIKNTYSSLRS